MSDISTKTPEIKQKLGASIMKLIALTEEAEEKGVSLESINSVQENLEDVLRFLEKVKKDS